MKKYHTLGAVITLGTTIILLNAATVLVNQYYPGAALGKLGGLGKTADDAGAPIAISGDNAYVAWWTNKTGNDEVMFRASGDNGQTFGDKIK